jgi:hypothetical protein
MEKFQNTKFFYLSERNVHIGIRIVFVSKLVLPNIFVMLMSVPPVFD